MTQKEDPRHEGQADVEATEVVERKLEPQSIDDGTIRIRRDVLLGLVVKFNKVTRDAAKAAGEQLPEPIAIEELASRAAMIPGWYTPAPGRLRAYVHFPEWRSAAAGPVLLVDGAFGHVREAIRAAQNAGPEGDRAHGLFARAYLYGGSFDGLGASAPPLNREDANAWVAWFNGLPHRVADRLADAFILFRNGVVEEGNG